MKGNGLVQQPMLDLNLAQGADFAAKDDAQSCSTQPRNRAAREQQTRLSQLLAAVKSRLP